MFQEWTVVLGGTLLGLGVGLMYIGQVFGLVAIPNLPHKERWKVILLIVCMVIPLVGAVVCLLNYRKTEYASRYIAGGLVMAIVGLLMILFSAKSMLG